MKTGRLLQRRFAIATATLCQLLFSGCIFLVPYVEPDEQAKANGACVSCRARLAYSQQNYTPIPAKVPKNNRMTKLIQQLDGAKPVDRAHAAFWLGELGPQARPATTALIRKLSDENKWVRRATAKALGKIGDLRAKDGLKTASHDPDPFVAESARQSLRALHDS